MNIKCPCINCICVPMCRHKTFDNLYDSCILVEQYYYDSNLPSPPIHRLCISKALKPTRWKVDGSGYFTVQEI